MKFFDKIRKLFGCYKKEPDPQMASIVIRSTTKEIEILVSERIFEEFEMMRRNSGCTNDKIFFLSMQALTRWFFAKLDQGYKVGAFDKAANSYTELVMGGNFFPGYADMSNEEVSVKEITYQRAMKHFHWVEEMRMRGYEIGARKGDEFEISPEFK
jgi:hypothetical protein